MVQQRPILAHSTSLPEVHETVATSHPHFWRRLFAFAGPAYLVSVGYMDPGNWATDLEGGAKFGYSLLWVLVMANAMALLLQTLSARLGIVTRRDLAQACRDEYPRPVSYVLWILSELAIVACDLAEVLGAAIGLNLLFKLPLLAGVLLTAADTLLILWFTRYGIRIIEAFVIVLILSIGGCFAFEIFLAHPDTHELMTGLIPHLSSKSLYISVAILGATVMPHNLYLHSALVQTRRIGSSIDEKRTACRYNFLDSMFALNAALLVNAAILVLSAAVFYKRGIIVTEIQQAHYLLTPVTGTAVASVLFGVALICSGQSSTLTGTMAGQIVMEGFLRFKVQPWLRRAITRLLAIIPAALTIYYAGDQGTYGLLILSQVILSLQLPFAVIPLVTFTGDRNRMGVFRNSSLVKFLAWTTTTIILGLNIFLAKEQIVAWTGHSGAMRPVIVTGVVLMSAVLCSVLFTISLWPWLGKRRIPQERVAVEFSAVAKPVPMPPSYRRILVPLDHSPADRNAIANAVTLARSHNAEVILLHVEEGVPSRMYGSLASTAEINEGLEYLNEVMAALREEGVSAEVRVQHGKSATAEIARAAKQLNPDLLIMAAHGHRGLKDLIFGTTINSVRHHVKIPILIV
jgi:manganese transport protein